MKHPFAISHCGKMFEMPNNKKLSIIVAMLNAGFINKLQVMQLLSVHL